MNEENRKLVELAQRGITFREAQKAKPEKDNKYIRFIATSETPTTVFDWERWEYVDEVLLMDGFKLRSGDQVPFCDSHNRSRCADVFGRAFNWSVKGDRVEADVEFADDENSQNIKAKYEKGILTDCSIGYIVEKSVYIAENESGVVNGRTFNGPLKVSTEWRVLELSGTPVGADVEAVAKKGRSFVFSDNSKGDKMGDKVKKDEPVAEVQVKEDVKVEAPKGISMEEVRKQLADQLIKERERSAEITAMTSKFGMSERAAELIASDKSVDEVRKEIMDSYVRDNKEENVATVVPGQDARDKFVRAASDALLIRAGLPVEEKEADGARDLVDFSLFDLSKECVRLAGGSTRGTKLEIIQRALSTSDLPNVLANTANKKMNIAFDSTPATWKEWCSTSEVADFKTHTLVKLSEGSALDLVSENGEYKHGSISDEAETYKLLTYGKEYTFGRHMLINDDLNALMDWLNVMGENGANKVSDLVYASGDLLGNPTMGDSNSLFDTSNHGNLASSGAAPSITTIGAAVTAMKKQTDLAGERKLAIQPVYFIAPVGLETTSEQLFRSQMEGTQAKPTTINPYAGSFLKRIYEVRLDPTSGALPWYILGTKGKTAEVVFLRGSNQRPILEWSREFNTSGIKYRVTLDCAVYAKDYRAFYKNPGA